jgi:lipopolysaccharide transport system permease protein
MDTLRFLLAQRRYILRNGFNDLRYRYAGSGIGVFWNVVNPLAQVLVFGVVVRFALPRPAEAPGQLGLWLALGLLPWLAFTEALVRGSQSLVYHRAHLRTTAVAPEVFVAASAVASAWSLVITLGLLLVLSLASGQRPSWALGLLPVAAALLALLAFGISLVLGSLRVFFADVSEVLRVSLQLWMWSMPIVYSEDLLPRAASRALALNPPYAYLRAIRGLYLGRLPATDEWMAMIVWAAVAVAGGALLAGQLRTSVRDAL